MTEIKNSEYILEAIDQLRRRKARPDIHRICNFMNRRFAIDCRDTKADLQRCVENDIVLKVEYKGNISYRNAAKKSYGHIKHVKKDAQSPVDIKTAENRKLFPGIVTTAVADLFLEDSDYLDFGVPHTELVRKILSQHSPKFNKKTITELLLREVENGGLIKMDNGNFSLGPSQQTENEQNLETLHYSNDQSKEMSSQDDSERMEYEEYSTMNSNGDNPPIKIRKKPGPKPGKRKNEMEKLRNLETASIRLGGRRKFPLDYTHSNVTKDRNCNYRVEMNKERAKKVFDPSDNNLPRLNRKRGRPLGSLNKTTLEKQTVIGPRQYGASYPASIGESTENPDSRPVSRTSSVGGSPRENVVGVCSVCHTQGKKGPCDKMIGCRECSNKAHLSCLNEDGILRLYPDHTWQCPHCKTCVVCYETSDAGSLTVCSICADAYHSFCHEPKILEKPKIGEKWVCNNCQMEPLLTDIKPKVEIKTEVEVKSEDNKSVIMSIDRSSPSPPNSNMSSPYIHSPPGSPTPPTLSPQANHRDSAHNSTNHNPSTLNSRTHIPENINYRYFNALNLSDSQSLKDFEVDDFDPTIPDASNWTYDDVYNYFVQYFPEEAIVFKEQEIDGHSLLLMKRVDVLTSLNLKLGPALKIYRHVLKLQVRRDDHKLYWL